MAPGREKKHKEWYRLDNAAVVYAAIQKENYSAVYRFSAVMDQLVDPDALQRAVDILPGDTPEILQRRVMEQAEWILLPAAAELAAKTLTERSTQQ